MPPMSDSSPSAPGTLLADLADVVACCRALPLPRLVEALRADQAQRWRAGRRVLAEAYLEAFPALAASAEDALVLIWGEALLRFERGEAPRLAEYRHRFPQHFEALVVQFELQRHLGAAPDATLLGLPVEGDAAPQALPEVPGYLVLGELGRGAMGVVYKARQVGLDRVVALKMVLAGTQASPEQLVRFLQEAELAAQLAHPNIVAVHQVGMHADCPYLALEFVDGPSLAQKCGGTPQPPREAARLVELLAAAVHEAHQRGIVHRDLKPANVLLTSAGVPKIADFGLAKRVAGDSQLTQTGVILGTPSYMAPEQATPRNKAVGAAADVYALGAILYDLLTGRPPFQGETAWDTMQLVVSRAPVPPRRSRPNVPPDLEAICLKCLEKQRSQRYISARALADDLCRYLNGEPVQARAAPWWERAWRRAQRRPVAVFGLLVEIAVGAGLRWRLKRAPEEARAALLPYDTEPAHGRTGPADDTIGLSFGADLQRYARMNQAGELTVYRLGSAGEEVIARLPAFGSPPFSGPQMSPDGRFVACRCGRGPDGYRVRLWKLDPDPAVWLEGPANSYPGALAFSADSRLLAVVGADGSVHTFSLATGQRVRQWQADGPVTHLAFHPRLARMAVVSGGKVSLVDVSTGREVSALPHPATACSVSGTPKGGG
jgi:tRNA A-37 threonylcarbamoyl transferase component Bud32